MKKHSVLGALLAIAVAVPAFTSCSDALKDILDELIWRQTGIELTSEESLYDLDPGELAASLPGGIPVDIELFDYHDESK